MTPTNTVTPTVTPSVGSNEGPFDALYSPSFQLVSNQTNYSRPVQVEPAKMTTDTVAGYTDAVFGTKVFGIVKTTDIADSVTNLRHVYSRQAAFNADGSRLAARAGNGWWYVYNTANGQKLNGGRVLTPGTTGLNGPANECELTWHPTDPNKLWYTANYGSLVYYEYNLTTNTSSTLFDLTSLIAALGPSWSGAYRAWWRGEGRPSNDGRWWCLQVETSGYGMIGLIMYDRQNHQIVGSILTNNRPDHCSTSPLGNYGVVSWYGGTTQNMTNSALQPINSANGARAYSRDFSTFTQLSVLGEHSDCAIDASGNEVFVSVSYRGGAGGQEPDVTDGSIYYRRMDNGEAVTLPMSGYAGSSDAACHFSGLLAKQGWVVVSWYGGTPATWKDGTVSLVELVPTAQRTLRVCHHQSVYGGNYINESHACIDPLGHRIVFASNFGTSITVDYMVGLPSWAIPDAGANITPTPTATVTRTVTPTPVTPTPTPTISLTPVTPTPTPTVSISPTITPTISVTPTVTPTLIPFTAATLSSSLKGSLYTLSNGNRTAATSNASGFFQDAGMSGAVRTPTAGSYYWEVTITGSINTTSMFLGLYDTNTFDSQYGGPGVATLRSDGYIFTEGDNTYIATTAYTTGTTLKFLLKNGKLYVGNASLSTWFNSGNITAETGFIYDFNGKPYTATAPGYGVLRDNDPNVLTYAFNFGQSAFVGAVPSGATAGWPAA